MATKKISAMTAATALTGAELVPIVQGGANKIVTPDLQYLEFAYQNKLLASMGSSLGVAMTMPLYAVTATQTLVDNRQYMTPIYLYKDATITGVKFIQSIQGNYTGDQNNRIGLYTIAAGVLTLVASCANDANFWTGAPSLIAKAFSAPYVATKGLYYIGYLYNQSAQTTAPTIGQSTLPTGLTTFDFTNALMISCYKATNDLVVSTTNINTFSAGASYAFFMLY